MKRSACVLAPIFISSAQFKVTTICERELPLTFRYDKATRPTSVHLLKVAYGELLTARRLGREVGLTIAPKPCNSEDVRVLLTVLDLIRNTEILLQSVAGVVRC